MHATEYCFGVIATAAVAAAAAVQPMTVNSTAKILFRLFHW